MAKKQANNPADVAKAAGKLGELRKRFLFLIGALIVFRVGTFIPVPGVDQAALDRLFQNNALLGMLNLFSGSALDSAIQEKIDSGESVVVPLYDQFTGSGSNTNVWLSGFAGFKFTAIEGNGSKRSYEGQFVGEHPCPSGCTTGSEEGEGATVTNITTSQFSNLQMVGRTLSN